MRLFFLFSLSLFATTVFALPLKIITRDQVISIDVEVAATEKEKAKGLMFRTFLAKNAGMLFLDAEENWWAMWMKNTLIPLDMIFFDKTGKITYIAENTTPHSLTTIKQRAKGVLEVNAFFSRENKIAVGDRIEF